MANFLKNLGAKVKSAASRTADLAGRGALYSQMMNDPSNNLTMGQRMGGVGSKFLIDATLGNMGTLGQALGAGMEARGRRNAPKESPTGTDGVGGSNIPFKPIKTENVVQAINQSTQQMLSGLNTLNATFRMGLNATANQMQAQVSGISSLKRDTEDMVIGLREIYEVLNRMGYQDRGKGGTGALGGTMGDNAVTPGSSNSLLGNILTGLLAEKLLGNALPDSIGKDDKTKPRDTKNPRGSLLKRGLGALKSLKGLSITSLLGGLALDYGSDYAKESGYEKTGAGLSIMSSVLSGAGMGGMAGALAGGGIGSIPLGLIGAIGGGAAGLGYGLYNEGSELFGIGKDDLSSVPTATTTGRTQSNVIAKEAPSPNISEPAYNPNRSRAQAIQQGLTAGTELNTQEIDALFKAAPSNLSDDGLLALAQKMFPGRKYNTLKNRMQQLHMMMQPGPQSALESGVKVASAGTLSSGDYLVNRQKMLDSQKDQTSESKLRAKEQEYEQAVKDILQTIKYEARDVLFEADNIKFDASKIEFTQGGEGGGEGGYGPGGGLIPGGGADNWREGGTESRDGSGIGGGPAATKVPMSEETRKAAEQLQQTGSLTTLPGQDALAGYSDEQLQSLGVTRKEVRGAKGGREYSYDTERSKQAAAQGTAREKAERYLGRNMSDEEYDYLIRATHAEAAAGKKADPKEQAMVMASILNRARDKGENGVITALKEKNQFQSVTGTKYDRGPSKHFAQGPDASRLQSIEGSTDMLGAIPFEQKNFTAASSAAYGPGTNIGYRDEMLKQGGTVVGGSVFQTNPDFSATQSLTGALSNITPANMPQMVASATGAEGVPADGRFDEKYYENILKQYDIHAGREGSTENLSPEMKARLGALFRDAPEHVKKELKIQSAWRSQKHQDQLKARAGGSPYVAKKSKHTSGLAVDLGSGKGGSAQESFQNLSPDTQQWLIQNSEKYGLYRPMQPGKTSITEDWHFEPIGSRSGKPNQPKANMSEWQDPLALQQAEMKRKQEEELQKKQQAEAQRTRQEEINKKAAMAPPSGIATPAQLNPTAIQASQKVSELSKKTTMNRETAASKQGPVTQNIVNNNKTTADSTGNDAYDKNSPYPAMGGTMQKYVSMYFGENKQTAAV